MKLKQTKLCNEMIIFPNYETSRNFRVRFVSPERPATTCFPPKRIISLSMTLPEKLSLGGHPFSDSSRASRHVTYVANPSNLGYRRNCARGESTGREICSFEMQRALKRAVDPFVEEYSWIVGFHHVV